MNKITNKPRSMWSRMRLQLGGCLLLAAFLPFCVRGFFAVGPSDIKLLTITLIGTVIAIIGASWMVRSVQTYPGAEASAYILPSFTVVYTILLSTLVFWRIPYSLFTLISGFFISILWYYFVAVKVQRERYPRIGFLPFGETEKLVAVPRVDWVPLHAPDASFENLDAVAADLRIDLPSEWDRRLADFALDGIRVFHIKHLHESLTGRVELEHLSENDFGALGPRLDYMAVKHSADFIAAVVAGVLLLPLLIVVGLIVKTTSPGPTLFKQHRVGYRGRSFKVYKFRTMSVAPPDPSDERAAAITRAADPRITPFGRFLRTSRIDELPQIINVLRGEMSWIGPRPEAEILSKWYEAEIPFYRYRHIVRPGIAGWAQVCQGHVADVHEVREKLHFDFYYIKHYSPWIDLLIVARTIKTMLTGFGSR